MLTDKQYQKFGKQFIDKYLSNGFGAMPKSEIDILVFHLLSESEEIKDKSNYHIANKLMITESKVKSLSLHSSLKYKPVNHKSILSNIVDRVCSEMQKTEFNDQVVTISIESPVDQREFVHAVKSIGRSIEYGLNRELLKISPLALFELVVLNLENPEKEFTKIVQTHIKDKEMKASLINSALTLRQKINKIGDEVSDKSGLIGLLGSASAALI